MKKLFINTATKAKSWCASVDAAKALRFGQTALILTAACSMAMANTAALQQLNTQVSPWITTGIKIFGGILGLGGFAVAIAGFTGQNEGFDKVQKIAVGFVGIGLGVWAVGNPDGIRTMLNLDAIFT